jgi:hypothetical protein
MSVVSNDSSVQANMESLSRIAIMSLFYFIRFFLNLLIVCIGLSSCRDNVAKFWSMLVEIKTAASVGKDAAAEEEDAAALRRKMQCARRKTLSPPPRTMTLLPRRMHDTPAEEEDAAADEKDAATKEKDVTSAAAAAMAAAKQEADNMAA